MQNETINSLKEKIFQLEKENSNLQSEISKIKEVNAYAKNIDFEEFDVIYKLFSTQTLEGVVILQNYKVVFTNYKLPEIIGFTRDEILETTLEKIIHNDDLNLVLDRYKRRIAGENVVNQYYIRILHKNGTVRWVLLRSSKITWNNQDAILGIITDVTEQKEIEQKLDFTNSKYKNLFNSIKDIVMFFDNDFVLQSANPSALEFITDKKPIGKKLTTLFSEDLRNRIKENIDMVFEKQTAVERKDAYLEHLHNRWFLSTYMPVFNNSNQIIGVEIISKDVTHLKNIEEELLHAKHKAEESDRLKSSFLANMSHEIRTPMNGIIGFTQLLKDEYIDPQTRKEYLQYINSCSENLLNLIDEIIDISKIEAGQTSINIIDFKLHNLLNELEMFYNKEKFKLNKSEIAIVLKKETHNQCIFTDPNRLKQIIINLINNALRYTEKGSVEFGYTFNEKNNFVFYVKDTGVGIKKENQNAVFERFFQVEDKQFQSKKGAGLGLSICKSLVTILGGEMWLTSEENVGTTFFFTIPNNQPTREIDFKHIHNSDANHSFDWSNKKVLIVEDDDINYILLKEALKKSNIHITRAADGQIAIDLINSDKFDLILLDIQLPKFNGFEVLTHIKKLEIKTPVFIQTAFAMADEKDLICVTGSLFVVAGAIEQAQTLHLKM